VCLVGSLLAASSLSSLAHQKPPKGCRREPPVIVTSNYHFHFFIVQVGQVCTRQSCRRKLVAFPTRNSPQAGIYETQFFFSWHWGSSKFMQTRAIIQQLHGSHGSRWPPATLSVRERLCPRKLAADTASRAAPLWLLRVTAAGCSPVVCFRCVFSR
jgi:hypothetical protein